MKFLSTFGVQVREPESSWVKVPLLENGSRFAHGKENVHSSIKYNYFKTATNF